MEDCRKIILLSGKIGRQGLDDKKMVIKEPLAKKSSKEMTVFEDSKLPIEGFARLTEMRTKKELCDVALKVNGQVIKAHRLVLAATIPYFDSMFLNHMTETKQIEIVFQGLVDGVTMEALVNYAYTGKITLNVENVKSLMVGASFLKLDKVRDACAEIFISNLCPTNALSTCMLAERLNCQALVDQATKYINQYFQQAIDSDEILELTFDNMKKLISKNDIHVASESQVFETVIRWVKHDENERSKHLVDLLRLVRLPLLKPDYLVTHAAKETLIKLSPECRDLIDEAKDCYLMRRRKYLQDDYGFRPRVCNGLIGHIFAVGGLSKDGNYWSTTEVYDPCHKVWKKSAAMTVDRTNAAAAVYDNKLYVFGGRNRAGVRLSTVEVYHPDSKSWRFLGSMEVARSHSGAAALNDYLYVCGGHDGSIFLNTVERYCPLTEKWQVIHPMNKNRCSVAVVAFEGYIYAFGGEDCGRILDSAERYDPITCEWRTIKPMLIQRCSLGVAVLNGKVYVSGGYDGDEFLRSVEVYDPQTDSWKFVASMNMARCLTSLITNMGRLWAIGGNDGLSDLSQVEVYDPETDTWSFATPMCSHKGAVSAGVIAYPFA